ncbi:MAG TPA: PHP domain-containing protein [Candidatus Cloacimonadota bacterium]|nr:PHP domain-containing protein [Candidatus Cloacimonadota bacterium]
MNKRFFQRDFIELTGTIHNHTVYSFDSDEPVSSIIQAAKKNKLDYVCFTDHHNLDLLNDKDFMKEKRIILIPGMEISDLDDEHHLLVFNSKTVIPPGKVEDYLPMYNREGAITFAAHPLEDRQDDRYPKYQWSKLYLDSFDGIEIWNFISSWLKTMNYWKNGAFHLLFPQMFIRRPYRKVLKYWDDLNLQGKHKSGIGAIDAHGVSIRILGLRVKVLTHKHLFAYIRTNVLIPSKDDITQADILLALRNGNSYVVNQRIGIPYNFYAGITDSEGNNATFGEDIHFKKDMRLFYNLPKSGRIHLIYNGETIEKRSGSKGYFEIRKPGFYRLEILRYFLGWIYTNPIYVKGGE